MAEKLALIDKDLLLRLLSRHSNPVPPPDPVLKQIERINDQLQTTLESSDTPDRLKSKKVNELLVKHDTFRKQYENQSGYTIPQGPPPGTPQGTAPDVDHWVKKTVSAAPPRSKKITEALLDHIRSSNRMRWDSDGRLVIDGTTIQGTNILDLVHGVTRRRTKAAVPEGTADFLNTLDAINTPRELVPNIDFLKTAKPVPVPVSQYSKGPSWSALARSKPLSKARFSPYHRRLRSAVLTPQGRHKKTEEEEEEEAYTTPPQKRKKWQTVE